jgi:hypothetical protein
MVKQIIEPINTDLDSLVKMSVTSKQGTKMNNAQIRFHESDLYIPTLRITNSSSGGFITTSDLIEQLECIFNITGEDAKILDGRSDTKFSQIVRNMVSHRDSPTNFIAKGFAEYDPTRRGIQITIKGRRLLTSIYDPE